MLPLTILAHNITPVNGAGSCIFLVAELCYNQQAMWLQVQVAIYASLVSGYALLLFLGIRYRVGRTGAQRYLTVVLSLALALILALAVLDLLFDGRWWAWVWYRTAQVGLVLLLLLTADMTGVFLGRIDWRWPRWVLAGTLSLAAFVVDSWLLAWLGDLSPLAFIVLGPMELASLLLALAWAVPFASALWGALSALRSAIGSKHRNRIRYLGAALICFLLGDLLTFSVGATGAYVGLASHLLGLGVFAFAILRHDLPDLKHQGLIALRVVVLATITAVFYVACLLVAGVLVGGLGSTARLQVVVPAAVIAVLLAAVIEVTLGPRIHLHLDRTVLGRNLEVRSALRTYSHQVSGFLDLGRLAEATLDWLRETLHVKRSAFILFTSLEDDQAELRVLRSRGFPGPPPQQFSSSSRFIRHVRNIGRPLTQYDLDMLSWFQVGREEERQWLKALEIEMYIPVLVADKPVALLALGPKGDGQPYSDEDIEILTTLAGQAGTALENARLFDDLRSVQWDLHRLNAELAETNRQLRRLDQTKSDFVAIASHELRTPLSQIFGYSDVLASLEGDELSDSQVVQQFISGISRGARRLQHVVDAMVDVSLIETGALKIRVSPVSIGEVIEHAVESVAEVARKRELVLAVGDLTGLPVIQADASRLEQVFSGLVRNAVKFTPDGGRISIRGLAGSPISGGAYLEILVSDQGIGIDPEQQMLIFEKFYRPENPLLHSTDDFAFKGAGPGLGLSIAKGIVEAHGGQIWAESPGRDEHACPGSTFHVRLPLIQPQ